jgi:acetyl esterase/lipase
MSKLFLGLLLALGCASPATSQADPTAPIAQVIAAVPGEQIPLATVDAGTPNTEQWNRAVGQVWVRNVSNPSLYPIRPKNGRGNGRAIIVVPGGGYSFVSIESEGFWVAERLAAKGYTAFVLKYRTRKTPEAASDFMRQVLAEWRGYGGDGDLRHLPAVSDLAAAVALVTSQAHEWGIDPNEVGVIGFSAGAMSTIRLLGEYDQASQIDNIALIYPPMGLEVKGGPRPDLFLAIAVDDPLFKIDDLTMVENWLAVNRTVEFHLYSTGGHGFGMRPQGTTSDLWIDQYLAWLEAR